MNAQYRRDAPVVWPSGFSALGAVLILICATTASPLLALPFFPREASTAGIYLIPAAAAGIAGFALIAIARRARAVGRTMPLGERDATAVVVAGWIIAFLIGSVPIGLSTGLDFTRSLFESVSGWTTTGLSVVDVEKAPRLLLLYRSVIQLVGGAGLAVSMLSVFSTTSGMGIARAEGRTYQLAPQVAHSAKLVVRLYAGYAIGGTILLALSGMPIFDAINHSFTAVSTGGFSTRVQSIGYWDSPLVEASTIVLMLLGNFNFITAYVLVRGKIGKFLKNAEIQVLAVAIGAASVLIFGLTVRGMYGSLAKEIRVAVFETVTAITTTGFSTVGYTDWKPIGVHIMIILMAIGGGICSTAGGIKQLRVAVLVKAAFKETKRLRSPRNAVLIERVVVGEDQTPLGDRAVADAGAFVFVYLAVLAIGTGILVANGFDFLPSVFEYASALGTVGLSVGIVSAAAPDSALWGMTAGMFMGRLEFFVIFASFGYAWRRVSASAKRAAAHRSAFFHSSRKASAYCWMPPKRRSMNEAAASPTKR